MAATAAVEEEAGPSVEKSTMKIGGVNVVVGWVAAAVILNDVLSNR